MASKKDMLMTEIKKKQSIEIGKKNLTEWGYDVKIKALGSAEIKYSAKIHLGFYKTGKYVSLSEMKINAKEAVKFADCETVGILIDREEDIIKVTPKQASEMMENLPAKEFITLYKIVDFKANIDLLNFGCNESGQKELWEKIQSLSGFLVTELDCEFDFIDANSRLGYSYAREEMLSRTEDPDVIELDARIYSTSADAVEDFWDFEYEDIFKEQMSYLDPANDVSVVHRKGKEWFIGNSIQSEEVTIRWMEEEYDHHGKGVGEFEEDEECFEYQYINRNVKAIRRVADFIQETIAYVKARSEATDAYNQDEYGASFPKKVYSKLESELGLSVSEITSEIAYLSRPSGLEVDIVRGIEMFLSKDLDKEKLLGKYKHLILFKKLASKDGYEVVIDNATGYDLYALKFKNELYHFYLADLFASNYKIFYQQAVSALAKRSLEKQKYKGLLEKAKYIYVGLQDSYSSGNCKPGTESFCKKHNIDTTKIGGVRGDVLLGMEFSNFTRRVVLTAIDKKRSNGI